MATNNNYFILDENNIQNYLKSINILDNFNSNNNIIVQSIGDGNLNNVFRVIYNNTSLIIKQALPYLKIVGPEYALSFERIAFEIEYFNVMAKISNVGLPSIYYTDKNFMKLIIMQDLNKHVVMRIGLIDNQKFSNFSTQISEYLATRLFYTSRLYLSQEEHEELKLKFNHNFLCKLTEDLVFTFPYFEHATNNKLTFKPQFSEEFIYNAWYLRNKFNTSNECLSHGDLHTGSIMLNQNEYFIIDSEFAFIGPIGFDIGLLFANLITMYITKFDIDDKKILEDMLIKIWYNFKNRFCKLWQDNLSPDDKLFLNHSFKNVQTQYLNLILNDALGFAGIEICRRITGIAGVQEIRSIENNSQRLQLEVKALAIGQKLVENYKQFIDIEELYSMING